VDEKRRDWNRWLLLAVKIGVIGVVIWFVRRTVVEAWSQLGEYPWSFHAGWLALASGLYVAGLFPAALFWYWCLRALGQHPHFGETVRAYYIGHLGKYVPGKAMVVVIRAGMVGGDRVDMKVAAASVFLESLTWIAVASFLAAGYLAASVSHGNAVFWASLGLMAGTGIPTLPPVFPWLARLAGVGRGDPEILDKLHRLGYGTTLVGWILMSIGWVLMGLAYWATVRAVSVPGIEGLAELPRYTAAVSLAVVVGFVAIFIPAGMGVREAALVEIMMPYLVGVTTSAALVAWATAVLFRLVSVVSELGISGILYVAGIRRPNRPPAEPPTAQDA
jgi:uncharacterized membrane protein YbhN (UPF0104 family)